MKLSIIYENKLTGTSIRRGKRYNKKFEYNKTRNRNNGIDYQ